MIEKTFDQKFWWGIFIFSVFILVVCTFPFLMTNYSWFGIDFSQTGEVGSTIGGIMGPFIAVGAGILTFLAFWVQYKANLFQRRQFITDQRRFQKEFIEQRKSEEKKELTWHIERFENKFYNLIRLHKENVDEISIGYLDYNVQRRKAFVSMFNEYRYTFYYCRYASRTLFKTKKIATEYSDEQLLRLAYIFFYAGVGNNSDVVSRSMNDNESTKFEDRLFEKVMQCLKLEKTRDVHKQFKDSDNNIVSLNIQYKPWGGHQSRLGHYYRHLFQTVKYVVSQNEKLLDFTGKNEYLKTLRAQLSDYEQLMLYYNAASTFGEAWDTNEYLTTWRMIHNIPLPLANFGITPTIKYKDQLTKIDNLFEWLE